MASAPATASEKLSIFDTYVCREPAGDVPLLMRNGPDEFSGLLRSLQRSAEYFTEHNQPRIVERIHYEQAMLHLQHRNWKHAMKILLPLWQNLSWRKAGWWLLLEEVDRALQTCATEVRDTDTLISVQWELLNNALTPQRGSDFTKAIDGIEIGTIRPRPKLRSENVLCPVSASIAFLSPEAHVGLPLSYQLVLKSLGSSQSPILKIQRINVAFEGPLRSVHLQHTEQSPIKTPGTTMRDVKLEMKTPSSDDEPPSPLLQNRSDYLHGSTDLSLPAGSTSVLCLSDVPWEAEDLEVVRITLFLSEKDFDLELVVSEDVELHQDVIFSELGEQLVSKIHPTDNSHAIKVLPKPPRLRLTFISNSLALFTDQASTMELEVRNEEKEEITVRLDLQVLDESEDSPSVQWATESLSSDYEKSVTTSDHPQDETPSATMLPSTYKTHKVTVIAGARPSEHGFCIRAQYFLKSDPETPISVSIKREIIVRRPFESTFGFLPIPHAAPWPNYFEIHESSEVDGTLRETSSDAQGLSQRWLLSANIVSLASDELVLKDVRLDVIGIHEAAVCKVGPNKDTSQRLASGGILEQRFHLDVQKLSIEDRRLTYLESCLRIVWTLADSDSAEIVSSLPVPELAVPFGEPRVLASLESPAKQPSPAVPIAYMIENPSAFTLTFNVMLETSDEFAFSGSKNMSLQLVPLSRQSVRYLLMPLVNGTWIHPQLRVYDVMFHKTLKVQGGEGMRNDRKGIGIWIDADG